jgi:hypothetical protein
MNRKLTLTVEEEIIIRAKAYAEETGRSLSDLVQNYLDRIKKIILFIPKLTESLKNQAGIENYQEL